MGRWRVFGTDTRRAVTDASWRRPPVRKPASRRQHTVAKTRQSSCASVRQVARAVRRDTGRSVPHHLRSIKPQKAERRRYRRFVHPSAAVLHGKDTGSTIIARCTMKFDVAAPHEDCRRDRQHRDGGNGDGDQHEVKGVPSSAVSHNKAVERTAETARHHGAGIVRLAH